MWINNIFLPMHSHSWGTMMSRSCPSTPQLATCGPSIHLALFKWPASNLAQWCTVTCQMMFAKCPASTNWFEIFKKFMQKLKVATYLWTINHLALFKNGLKFGKQGCVYSNMPSDVCTICPAYLVWNFHDEIHERTNLGSPYNLFSMHLPKSNLASCM